MICWLTLGHGSEAWFGRAGGVKRDAAGVVCLLPAKHGVARSGRARNLEGCMQFRGGPTCGGAAFFYWLASGDVRMSGRLGCFGRGTGGTTVGPTSRLLL